MKHKERKLCKQCYYLSNDKLIRELHISSLTGRDSGYELREIIYLIRHEDDSVTKYLFFWEKSSNFTDSPVFDLLFVETSNSKSNYTAISLNGHLWQWYTLRPKITQMVCVLLFWLWFGIGRFHPYSSRALIQYKDHILPV